MADTIRLSNLGPLHDLLLKACPPNDSDFRSIPILAEAIGYTPAGVYKMIRQNKMSPTAASKVVEANEAYGKKLLAEDPDAEFEPVTLEDFHPYVYV